MENKYYTPTIEEFHKGFEYEEMIRFSTFRNEADDFVKRSFQNCKAKSTDELTCIEYDLDGGGHNVRVKFLDKDDIGSCGWTIKKVFDEDGYYFIKAIIPHSYEDNGVKKSLNWEIIMNRESELFPNRYCVIRNIFQEICFKGIIKNKSELNRIIQQLGINE